EGPARDILPRGPPGPAGEPVCSQCGGVARGVQRRERDRRGIARHFATSAHTANIAASRTTAYSLSRCSAASCGGRVRTYGARMRRWSPSMSTVVATKVATYAGAGAWPATWLVALASRV